MCCTTQLADSIGSKVLCVSQWQWESGHDNMDDVNTTTDQVFLPNTSTLATCVLTQHYEYPLLGNIASSSASHRDLARLH